MKKIIFLDFYGVITTMASRYSLVGLVPDRRADEEDVRCFKDKGMETGDYLIEAH